MIRQALLVSVLAASALSAQAPDTSLVRRILFAEDRRDTTDRALAEGMASRDARVALIARRAMARMRDAKFAARDSLGALPAPPAYPEPDWRVRYRALATRNADCTALGAALTDASWHVRLRAADLAGTACRGDVAFTATMRAWLATSGNAVRARDDAAWQPAAHAIVALSRAAPQVARAELPSFLRHDTHWVRVYAARAAAVLTDTQALRALAGDRNDNVREAAIDALSKLTAHADDSLYVAALQSKGYQAVRSAALALKGATPTRPMRHALVTTAQRLRADSSETSRDARTEVMARLAEMADAQMAAHVATLATDFDCVIAAKAADIATALGKPTAPQCTPFVRSLPADAVRLALGADVRLRVVMSPSSGGGSFVVRLRGDVAPIMAARVLSLARTGYYDRQAWHRVEPNFVIQGPSPGDNEYVGHPRFLRDELGAVPHVRGTVGMSTRGHDTGDAQWFVNLKDNLNLGRDYTVFGEIVEGIEVADSVLEGDVIERIEVVRGR
ncbi:MAG: peptidylprolyl isomerase [Gemmatimonadaceae bacterium]|jgi:cyclophilin family peptidyl-prolyl cis-trans isomerase